MTVLRAYIELSQLGVRQIDPSGVQTSDPRDHTSLVTAAVRDLTRGYDRRENVDPCVGSNDDVVSMSMELYWFRNVNYITKTVGLPPWIVVRKESQTTHHMTLVAGRKKCTDPVILRYTPFPAKQCKSYMAEGEVLQIKRKSYAPHTESIRIAALRTSCGLRAGDVDPVVDVEMGEIGASHPPTGSVANATTTGFAATFIVVSIAVLSESKTISGSFLPTLLRSEQAFDRSSGGNTLPLGPRINTIISSATEIFGIASGLAVLLTAGAPLAEGPSTAADPGIGCSGPSGEKSAESTCDTTPDR